jgi:hypothetical protein
MKEDGISEHAARVGKMRDSLVRKPEVKRLLGINIRRWQDNIRMDVKEI